MPAMTNERASEAVRKPHDHRRGKGAGSAPLIATVPAGETVREVVEPGAFTLPSPASRPSPHSLRGAHNAKRVGLSFCNK